MLASGPRSTRDGDAWERGPRSPQDEWFVRFSAAVTTAFPPPEATAPPDVDARLDGVVDDAPEPWASRVDAIRADVAQARGLSFTSSSVTRRARATRTARQAWLDARDHRRGVTAGAAVLALAVTAAFVLVAWGGARTGLAWLALTELVVVGCLLLGVGVAGGSPRGWLRSVDVVLGVSAVVLGFIGLAIALVGPQGAGTGAVAGGSGRGRRGGRRGPCPRRPGSTGAADRRARTPRSGAQRVPGRGSGHCS